MPMPIEITPTEIEGVLEVRGRLFTDHRGFFTELYNTDTWVEQGFTARFMQDNLSLSCKGTLRGLHYQIEPHGMGKLVRAITGRVFDVGVDLRRGSPTFGKWVGRELSADDPMALYFPPQFAHGFVALEDNSLVLYKCTSTHAPDAERILNYKDPEIGIAWPLDPTEITDKDAQGPSLQDADFNFVHQPS